MHRSGLAGPSPRSPVMNPARILSLIKKIEVDETHTNWGNKVYIDFYDQSRIRFYVMFLPDQRIFGVARKIDTDGGGMCEVAAHLREHLISIIPPDIIARCTAASLGIRPD